MSNLDDLSAYRLAAIVQSSDDAIVSKDLNGIVKTWNPAAERMFGFTADEMIGASITKIIPPERLPEEDHVLGEIRAGRLVDHFETVRRRKDGSLLDVSLTVSPVKTPDGRIVGASKIARDITERKRLAEIQRLLLEREERAKREALEAENRRILEGSRLKSLFVANVSHELRTPLQAIIGFSELMVDQRFGAMPEKYHRMATTVLGSSQHLLRLINDILDLAKVESGRTEFHPEPLDLRTIIDEVRSSVQSMTTQNRIAIRVRVDPEIRRVTVDPVKLRQILYNYVSNAIKFTPEGGRVEIRALPDGDGCFRLEVEDTGIGIPADQHQRLFTEFLQLDSSTTKRYPGTGLGLALTKRLVEAQGGSVGFRSEESVGSVFYATLPRVAGDSAAPIRGGGDAAGRSTAAPECSPASR